jgi:hypothetical protein
MAGKGYAGCDSMLWLESPNSVRESPSNSAVLASHRAKHGRPAAKVRLGTTMRVQAYSTLERVRETIFAQGPDAPAFAKQLDWGIIPFVATMATSGRSAAWQRARIGTVRSGVQIPPPRLCSNTTTWSTRWCLCFPWRASTLISAAPYPGRAIPGQPTVTPQGGLCQIGGEIWSNSTKRTTR